MNAAGATPLDVREFFRGVWKGSGVLLPAWWIRWLCPAEQVEQASEAVWLSDTVWLVHDRFVFSSGRVIEGRMFSELVAPDRIHITADHMPMGADIHLSASGFRFTPYRVLAKYGGLRLELLCRDECALDAEGSIRDHIRFYWHGIPVGEMRIGPIRRAPDGPR